jgi:very-short-patch-repair endonuclease
MDLRYGAGKVDLMVELADPACESPGESRARLILRSLGMVFVAQAEIRAPGFLARVDFLIGRVVVEFDGAIKYADASGRAELVREKRREDELRRLGYEIVRLTWADLADPARVGRLIREAQVRAMRR